ncbi:MAG: hypothetical protein R3A46_02790 [Thermomicrobiales bacterium]
MTIEHHADFAVPITHHLWLETTVERPEGEGMIRGFAIALGWWVDPGQTNSEESTGTLYLVVDERGGPPRWIAEGNISASTLIAPAGYEKKLGT